MAVIILIGSLGLFVAACVAIIARLEWNADLCWNCAHQLDLDDNCPLCGADNALRDGGTKGGGK